jgi:hypothetical protein
MATFSARFGTVDNFRYKKTADSLLIPKV